MHAVRRLLYRGMNEWIDPTPQRIVVFRAQMLGELLCAVPALRALRAAFASAEITLVGLPCARTLAQRLPHLDHFIDFAGYPAISDGPCDVRALPDFLACVQAQRFDLALQMHGTGDAVNTLVASFGASQSAGFVGPNGWRPDADSPLYCAWPENGQETERLLALTDHLQLPRCGTELEFPLEQADRRALHEQWPDAASQRPYVCVHPGAALPSRRWDPRRFAALADAHADRGRTVVLTGSALEAGLVADLAACMRQKAVNLCGRTTLWTLGALIEGAESVLCNDNGVSHLATALGRPSVVVSCGADAEGRAPRDHSARRPERAARLVS
jgi:ADP-heptose:LPS heptosyltransferase